MGSIYAHSLQGASPAMWEPLAEHLTAVGDRAAGFASAFGWSEAARSAGLLHDIGKASGAVQAYLHGWSPSHPHARAGACVAAASYPAGLGRMIATVVAGHHAGLGDGADLDRRLAEGRTDLAACAGWERHAGVLPALAALRPARAPIENAAPGFTRMFLTRMLFSCLVDADFLETERFYARGASVERGGHPELATLRRRLSDHMNGIRATAAATPVNMVRLPLPFSIAGNGTLRRGV